MDATVLGIVGMCLIVVIMALARITAWWLDRRGYTAGQGAREAIAIAQARAELAATGWSPDHEMRYQAEIAATKRGDLLAAAELACMRGQGDEP